MYNCIVEELEQHAKECYPKECCGFIIQNMHGVKYYRGYNMSDSPTEDFVLSSSDYISASREGAIIGIAHSHPDKSCRPSDHDIASCDKSGLPWTIMGYPDRSLTTIQPKSRENRSYKGRKFVFGIDDCYTLIQDYYNKELNIELDNFYREDGFWQHGHNYYIDRFPSQGFVQVSDLKEHDLILIQLKADIPNHGAIYLGKGKILHHVAGRLSSETMYEGYWRRNTHTIIRHKNLL